MSLLSFLASWGSAATLALATPASSEQTTVETTIVLSGNDLEWNTSHLQYHAGDLGHRKYHTTKTREHGGWHTVHEDLPEEEVVVISEHRNLHRRMNHLHRVSHWGTSTMVTCVPRRLPGGVC